MPIREKGWDGDAKRWVKMYSGVRYRVTCEELGLPRHAWTKEGSFPAFKTWWEGKQAELDADPVREAYAATIGAQTAEELGRMVELGNFARAVIEQGKPPSAPRSQEELEQIFGFALEYPTEANPAQTVELLHKIGEKFGTAPASDYSTTSQAKKFLALSLAKGIKPRTYEELDKEVTKIAAALPSDARKINENTVTEYYLSLSKLAIVQEQKKKLLGFFRRLIRHFWSERLLELPRNLDQHSFKVHAKKVKTYALADVKGCLAGLTERLRLYALLGLNCGMLGVDIGQMKQEEADLKAGRIIRKRSKTEDQKNVPTVNYKLWPETLRLMRKHIAQHETFALTSSTNTPLWDYKVVNGKTKEKDLVRQQWKLNKSKLPHKAFRSFASGLIESHPDHWVFKEMFLGHSAKTMSEKHYGQTAQDRFDKAMDWLGKQLG